MCNVYWKSNGLPSSPRIDISAKYFLFEVQHNDKWIRVYFSILEWEGETVCAMIIICVTDVLAIAKNVKVMAH